MSEPMSDERRAEIVWRSERVGSQHWIKRAVGELLAEVDRLRSDLEAARPVLDAAKAWHACGADVVSPDGAVHRANRNLRRAVAALAEHTGDDE